MSDDKTQGKAGSKFSGLMAAVREREEAETPEQAVPAPTPAQSRTQTDAPAQTAQRGRPRGKRSDPDFEQVTAYIRGQTHRDVKIALLTEGGGREFSELVEALLAGWLADRAAGPTNC